MKSTWPLRSTRAGNGVLAPHEIGQVVDMWSTGEYTQKAIAVVFGVSDMTISRVIRAALGIEKGGRSRYANRHAPARRSVREAAKQIKCRHCGKCPWAAE